MKKIAVCAMFVVEAESVDDAKSHIQVVIEDGLYDHAAGTKARFSIVDSWLTDVQLECLHPGAYQGETCHHCGQYLDNVP